jgi:hypothetical protein
MTDFLDQKLTDGCAGSVMKVKGAENKWQVNFQSCTINLGTNNPNEGFGGQIRPDARPQFKDDVEELIEQMKLAGIDSQVETLECDAVRRHCDTGEFSVLLKGAESVKNDWKIITKGRGKRESVEMQSMVIEEAGKVFATLGIYPQGVEL